MKEEKQGSLALQVQATNLLQEVGTFFWMKIKEFPEKISNKRRTPPPLPAEFAKS